MSPSMKLVLAGVIFGAIGIALWRLFDEEDAPARTRHFELLGAVSVAFLGASLTLLGLMLAAFGG